MSPANFNVLVADDDPTVRLLAQAALDGQGFSVTAVADGAQALAEFQRRPSDIVLLDVDMPAVDGYLVCAELRRRIGPELPIVLITGHDDREAITTAFEAGTTDFIAKPVDWSSLASRLLKLLSKD